MEKRDSVIELTPRELELRVRSPSTVRRFRFDYDPCKDTPQSVATEIVQFLKIPPTQVQEATLLTQNHITNLLQIPSQNLSPQLLFENPEEFPKLFPRNPKQKIETLLSQNFLEFTLTTIGSSLPTTIM